MNATNLYNFVVKMKVFENYAKNKQKPKISFSLFSTSKKFFKSYFLLMKTY